MSWLREQNLLKLVYVLWNEIPAERRTELAPILGRSEAHWALHDTSCEHLDENDWLTPDQIAHECGIRTSTVRNWPKRYGLTSVKGRYRWGDIQELQRRRNQTHFQSRVSPTTSL